MASIDDQELIEAIGGAYDSVAEGQPLYPQYLFDKKIEGEDG